jgi:hypothetical protein
MTGAGADRLSLLGRALPPAFELLIVTLAPGHERAYEPVEWRDAIVVVERGAVELAGSRGDRARFERGDVLCLSGIPLRALRNGGPGPTVLSVVRRRAGRPAVSA